MTREFTIKTEAHDPNTTLVLCGSYRGQVWACDGVMYWQVYAGGPHGERAIEQGDGIVDASAKAARAYCIAAVKGEITRILDRG